MSASMQKQTARNMVLSPNAQAAYGGVIADANLSYLASFDPSTYFQTSDMRYDDAGSIGHGTDFATASVRTGWMTSASIKGKGGIDSWLLGYMMALVFGTDVVTGPGPYLHTFAINMATSLAACTTVYVEDTDDVHRKFPDMAAKSIQIDIPERGVIQASLDMVGTGRFVPGSFSTALPGVMAKTFLLGSDVQVTITPQGVGAVSFVGRTSGLSFKMDRGTKQFQSAGDGLTAGSVQYGTLGFGVDMTLMAQATDDVNGWFENGIPLSVKVATNPANAQQLILNFPLAMVKARKLGNKDNLVAYSLSFDQSTILQSGITPALSASIINTCAAYLLPV
jgi:hypothetical protein